MFDSFPEPVLYLSGDQIQYSNAAMLALDPTWRAGCPIPPPLRLTPEERGVTLCSAGQQQLQGTLARTGEGVLLILRPLAAPETGPEMLPGLLREQSQMILTALHLLEKERILSEDAALNAASVRKSAFSLLRLSHHLELDGRLACQKSIQLNLQPVDMTDLCRRTIQVIQGMTEDLDIKLTAQLPDTLILLSADETLLETMLLELLSNALKSAPRGGQVGLRLSDQSGSVLLTVWDNGPGLSDQALAGLFRASANPAPPEGSAGLHLGLSIANRIVQAHAGALLLENRQGLTATVSLPKKHTNTAVLHSSSLNQKRESSSLPLILLADALPRRAYLNQSPFHCEDEALF